MITTSLNTFNADTARAALRKAEQRLLDILKDLELNDIDNSALAARVREVEKGLRFLAA